MPVTTLGHLRGKLVVASARGPRLKQPLGQETGDGSPAPERTGQHVNLYVLTEQMLSAHRFRINHPHPHGCTPHFYTNQRPPLRSCGGIGSKGYAFAAMRAPASVKCSEHSDHAKRGILLQWYSTAHTVFTPPSFPRTPAPDRAPPTPVRSDLCRICHTARRAKTQHRLSRPVPRVHVSSYPGTRAAT